MKSRITIDVDFDNQPILRIEYCESEDVRDKLVKRFLETFAGDSCYALFNYMNSEGRMDSESDTRTTVAHVRPIKPENLKSEGENMIRMHEEFNELNKSLTEARFKKVKEQVESL